MLAVTWNLADYEDVLALFCQGISGRYLPIESTLEFDSPKLTLAPGEALQTADSIYLPETLRAYEPAAYRVLALIQIGYRECGAHRFSFDHLLHEAPQLRARTEANVTPGRGELSRLYLCFENPGLAREIFLLLEYARVLAHIKRVYPGIKPHLNRYFDYLLLENTASSAPLANAERALHGDTQAAFRLPPRLSEALTRTQNSQHDVYRSAVLLFAVYEELAPLYPIVHWPAQTHATDWLQREERLQEWEHNTLNELEEQLLAIHDPAAGAIAARQATGIHGATREELSVAPLQQARNDLARRAADERCSVTFALGNPHGSARSTRYDEWNYLERRYLKRWCRVFEEHLLHEAGETDIQRLRQVIRRWQPDIKKHLAAIRPMGWQRVRRVADGDELDLNAIVEARQDMRAGHSPEAHFYSRKQRINRDVCAAFLIDLSASTDDPIDKSTAATAPEPGREEPAAPMDQLAAPLTDPLSPWPDWDDELLAPQCDLPQRKVIDIQREAMALMAAALADLGDSYGIYGFSGYGKDRVEFFTAKDIAQPFTHQTLRTIAAMQPKRSTRMGAAIRHAAGKLLASGQALKLLLILSDGFPQDCDYGPERGEHEYGVQDTAKALQEARQKSIETFCMTVDRSRHDYLKRMCPASRYLVIEEIEDLPRALFKVYAALTGR
ncbi:MAG: hypothetical protein GKR94_24295 [Gammaproteobacteria bacterium]|nr:hypothetical protein [Gammaproteobacteria bacterium]